MSLCSLSFDTLLTIPGFFLPRFLSYRNHLSGPSVAGEASSDPPGRITVSYILCFNCRSADTLGFHLPVSGYGCSETSSFKLWMLCLSHHGDCPLKQPRGRRREQILAGCILTSMMFTHTNTQNTHTHNVKTIFLRLQSN